MFELDKNVPVSNLGEDFITDILPFLDNHQDVPPLPCEHTEATNPFPVVSDELPPWTLDQPWKECTPPNLDLNFPVLPPHSEVSESSESADCYAFCAVCTKPFNVRWNRSVRYAALSFSCPTCFENVFLSCIDGHGCFARKDDGRFSLCEECFLTYVAPQFDARECDPIQTQGHGRRPPNGSTKPNGTFGLLGSGTDGCGECAEEQSSHAEFIQSTTLQPALYREDTIKTVTAPSATVLSSEEVIPISKESGKRRGRKARCDVCKKTFANAQEKVMHVRELHQAAYRCKECGATLRNAENLRRHAMCHTRDARNACPRCGARFGHVRSLKAHKKMCGGGGERNSGIEQRTFGDGNDSVQLDKHFGELEDSQKFFPCPICGKKFSVRPSVSRHIRIVHQELKPHECVTCGKSFSSRYNLNVHSLKNH